MTDYPRLTAAEWETIIEAVALLDSELDEDDRAMQSKRKILDRGFRKIQSWHERDPIVSPQTKARAGRASEKRLPPRDER